jgi:DHA3 family macrolide efflux protein-like MFS transporter
MMQKEDPSQSLRPFFTIWASQAFSLLGSQLVQFAIVWYLAKTTGSATMLAMATLAALLPQILIGPFAGALVDRWNRRQVMLVVDASIAAATLLLAGLFWMNLAQVWLIYLLLLVRATGAAFHWPAMTASTTMMVPQKHLARVAGLNQTLSGFATIFIPPIGALAIETLSMQGVLAIDVATAIPAIVSLLFIPIPQPAHAATTRESSLLSSLWADMREGWRFIWNWKAFMVLMVIAIMINLLGRAAASLSPLMVLEHFGGGALELGWWQSAIGIGSVLGGVTLGIWGGFKRKVVTQNVALFLDGLAIIAITMTPKTSFAVVVALIFVVAFLETIAIGLGGALGQILIPPEMQGRVFGLVMSLSLALSPLGLLVAGPVADAFGVQFWWVLTGLMISGMGAVALAIPAVVRIEDTKRQV